MLVYLQQSSLVWLAPLAQQTLRGIIGILPGLACCCLFLYGSAALAQGNRIDESEVINTVQRPSDGPVVGAYYYPWYGVGKGTVDGDWQNLLRRKLVPVQNPKLGYYRSDDPVVINEHIKQSLQAGLTFWAVSWWGPGSATDQAIRNSILPHPEADKLRYAILYESTGRLGKMDQPDYQNLSEDFAYLLEHYFDDPNYLRIDDRPVVFIYLSRVYFRNQGLDDLAKLRKSFPNLYLIGDDVFGHEYESSWADNFDAVTAYDVYGQSTGIHKCTRAAVETLAGNYANAKEAANAVGTAFIPTVAPGYNDRAVRSGHPGSARYFADQAGSKEGSLFRAMIRDVALPNLDQRCGRIFMVTSFNEWYEDTQIEATSGNAGATTSDSSDNKQFFTGGDRYEDYGELYLDILREEVGRTSSRR